MVVQTKDFPWGAGIPLLFATVATAVIGGVISGGQSDPWYASLQKPFLTPPDLVFAIVWPALYLLMAGGAMIVLGRAGSFQRAISPLGIYYTMLAFNTAWSLVFFGFQDVPLAMGVLVALLLLIIAMMQDFWRYSHLAALLQIPYLIWVSFAAYLNSSIMIANSGG